MEFFLNFDKKDISNKVMEFLEINLDQEEDLHSMLFIQEIKKNSIKNNIFMIFKEVLFDDFESMLLQKLLISVINLYLMFTGSEYKIDETDSSEIF